MIETTTIEITVEQKRELDSLKTAEREPYKDVLERVIDDYEKSIGEYVTKEEAQKIAATKADDRIAERVVPEAQR